MNDLLRSSAFAGANQRIILCLLVHKAEAANLSRLVTIAATWLFRDVHDKGVWIERARSDH